MDYIPEEDCGMNRPKHVNIDNTKKESLLILTSILFSKILVTFYHNSKEAFIV